MSEPKITIDAASWNRVVRERDEARKDATSLAERLTALELSSTADLATLERERDEARAMARVKLITPQKNTPVAEYFSSSSTPETNSAFKFWPCEQMELVDAEFARKLERERDEARAVIRMLWQRAETYLDLSEEEIDRVNRSWGKSTK
jgi:hypothetical protein